MFTQRSLACVVVGLIVVVSVCAGCGGERGGDGGAAASTCSDVRFADAVLPRLSALERAVLRVDAGHGSVPALGSAAPVLVAAARRASDVLRAARACRAKVVRARALLLKATRGLLGAGRALEPIAGSSEQAFSQDQFLTDWYAGTQDFQNALVSLRAAGVRGLVQATGGKGVFVEAGCGSCHTLRAARAIGTIGPNLDAAKPTRSAVLSAVTDGAGIMVSFKGTLSAAQIDAVGDYLSHKAGK